MVRKSAWKKNTDWIEWQMRESPDGKLDLRKLKKKLQREQATAVAKHRSRNVN